MSLRLNGSHDETQPTNRETEMKSIDANRYATKKTIAQGMLDIALLTANASQLKYILQVGRKHEFYTLMLILISLSIILQLIVGILFVIIGSLNINRKPEQSAAVILNDLILVVIFVISVVNVIISSFGIENASQPLVLMHPHLDIITGILLIIQGSISLNKKNQQNIAEIMNHIILGLVFLTSFIDVIKIGFGFEPAIPLRN